MPQTFMTAKRRSLFPFLLAAALVSPLPAGAAAVSVKIDNFTFNPPELTIAPGDTVTWTNGDDIPHTVVGVDKSFKSKPLDSDDKFSFTFKEPGQYDYFCSIHPHMTGKIIVRTP
ncbi:cupredoxin domain-containing protein [Methylocella silvestris]|uniref:Amicyanin n=1 Tax=Methylocella silvestris TaxID=199596 RepID=A0A2J7TGW8_METSI|nr:cupredoxin family copper-binding protein [Methylocella silvestris]PNG26012.1 amicyanin [Methylocella silvestris]